MFLGAGLVLYPLTGAPAGGALSLLRRKLLGKPFLLFSTKKVWISWDVPLKSPPALLLEDCMVIPILFAQGTHRQYSTPAMVWQN